MMRSLSSGVAGLRAHQTKMDVIGTNIANVNTYGFKTSRVTFSDVYYQSLSAGSAPSNVTGGTNPTQIGYGSAVATIDVMNAQSGMSSTDRAMDVYVNGDGMIAVKDANGNLLYTRLGVLGFDADGNLVDSSGNFVMGFPIGDDGNIKVNADGTISIDELSKIYVDKDMLDEMVGISIGTTGEIVGTMPGDTMINVSSKLPSWLYGMEIKPDSDVVGNVNVTMEYRSETTDPIPANWITDISVKPNARLLGNYNFGISGDTITVTGPSGDIYTGTYRKNSVVDITNAAGDVIMTMTTHENNQPVDNDSIGSQIYGEELWLRLDYTDKGGNKCSEEVIYTEGNPSLTLGDITLLFNSGDKVDNTTTAEFAFASDNTFSTAVSDGTDGSYDAWLTSVFLNPESTYSEGDVTLSVGVAQTFVHNFVANNYAFLNFMENTAKIDELIGAMNVKGQYKITTVAEDANDPKQGYRFVVTSVADSSVFAKSQPVINPGDDVIFEFTPTGGTATEYNVGKVGASQFTAKPESGIGFQSNSVKSLIEKYGATGDYKLHVVETGADTGEYHVTLHYPGGTIAANGSPIAKDADVTINGVSLGSLSTTAIGAFDGGASLGTYGPYVSLDPPGQSFVTLSEKNTLRLTDASGSIVSEVQYNGASTITMGDMTLKVDVKKLQAYFAGRPNITDDDSSVKLGTLSFTTEPDYIFSGSLASAQAGIGESILIGRIAVAKIPNMVAMSQTGESYFETTANSGEATFCIPGLNGTGTLKAGYLEMSNVDLSKEFTEMITTQRGFQANTRIITVSDEMLNELVNLKR